MNRSCCSAKSDLSELESVGSTDRRLVLPVEDIAEIQVQPCQAPLIPLLFEDLARFLRRHKSLLVATRQTHPQKHPQNPPILGPFAWLRSTSQDVAA